MTKRRPKSKKKTSKPGETIKLTIPARQATQATTQSTSSSAQPSNLPVVQPVASTPVVEPLPKTPSPQHHDLSFGPELEDDIVITPRPKTPPLPSVRMDATIVKNQDTIRCGIGIHDLKQSL